MASLFCLLILIEETKGNKDFKVLALFYLLSYVPWHRATPDRGRVPQRCSTLICSPRILDRHIHTQTYSDRVELPTYM